MVSRTVVVILLIANVLVLLGQIWPEGAPPFAHTVHLATLAANILLLAVMLRRKVPRTS
jgi:hypothetical protein